MRLPLNNGGLINLDTNGTSATIFDTTDILNDGSNVQSTQQDWLVTLFCYPAPSGVVAFPYVDILKDGASIFVANTTALRFPTDASSGYQKAGVGPIKMLDRFACRGQMKIDVGILTGSGDQKCSFFGYYERAGEQEVPGHYRPLQPTNVLQSPWTPSWPRQLAVAAGAATQTEVLQLFDSSEERLDLVTLNVGGTVEDEAPTGSVEVIWPDGNSVTLDIRTSADSPYIQPIPLLEDFPMKAITGVGNTLSLRVTADNDQIMFAYADGRFTRS